MKLNIRAAYPHFLAIGLFIIISAIYFSPQLEGYVIYQSDHEQYIGMSQEIRNYSEKYGEETLWTGAAFAGMPTYQIAARVNNILNSIKNIILRIMPRPMGYMFFLMIGFYILLICLNVDPLLAIIGSIAFGLCSLNIMYLGNGHNAKVLAISFIPPMVGSLMYAYRKNQWVGSALLSIFVCLHLAANHVQMTYYFLFLLLGLLIVEFYRHIQENIIPKFIKVSTLLLIAGLIGLLPTATNLMTTKKYGEHTTRGKSELSEEVYQKVGGQKESTDALDPEYIKRYNYAKGETWSLIIPDIKGGQFGYIGNDKDILKKVDSRYRQAVGQQNRYWGEQASSGGTFYMGASIFLLFLLGMFFLKDRIKWALLVVTLLAVTLSWKQGIIIDFFIHNVPMFNKFRDSKMMLIIVQLSLPLVGMLFLKKLIEEPIDKKKFLYVTLSISGLIFLFYAMPNTWFDFMSADQSEQFNSQLDAYRSNPAAIDQLEGIRSGIIDARIAIFRKDCLRSLFYILLTGGLCYAMLIRKMQKTTFIIVLGFVVLIDMWGVAKRYLNNEKRGSQYLHWVDQYTYNNPIPPTQTDMAILNSELAENGALNMTIQKELIQFKNTEKWKPAQFNLEKAKLAFRELNFGTNYRVFTLVNPFTSSRACYFHKSIGGYHGAKLKRMDELIGTWIGREQMMLSQVLMNNPGEGQIVLNNVNIPVLSMLNTKYIIYDQTKMPAINPNIFGNAWYVKNIEIVENADEEFLALGNIDKNTAYVQNKYQDKIETGFQYDSTAQITMDQYLPNHLIYKTKAESQQFVVFSEIYYEDGWDAFIDGEKADYIKANFLLRAMNVPAGEHTIEFKFEPASYDKSRIISKAGSGLIIAFVLIMLFFNWKFKEQKEVRKEK